MHVAHVVHVPVLTSHKMMLYDDAQKICRSLIISLTIFFMTTNCKKHLHCSLNFKCIELKKGSELSRQKCKDILHVGIALHTVCTILHTYMYMDLCHLSANLISATYNSQNSFIISLAPSITGNRQIWLIIIFTSLLPPNSDHVMSHLRLCNLITRMQTSVPSMSRLQRRLGPKGLFMFL